MGKRKSNSFPRRTIKEGWIVIPRIPHRSFPRITPSFLKPDNVIIPSATATLEETYELAKQIDWHSADQQAQLHRCLTWLYLLGRSDQTEDTLAEHWDHIVNESKASRHVRSGNVQRDTAAYKMLETRVFGMLLASYWIRHISNGAPESIDTPEDNLQAGWFTTKDLSRLRTGVLDDEGKMRRLFRQLGRFKHTLAMIMQVANHIDVNELPTQDHLVVDEPVADANDVDADVAAVSAPSSEEEDHESDGEEAEEKQARTKPKKQKARRRPSSSGPRAALNTVKKIIAGPREDGKYQVAIVNGRRNRWKSPDEIKVMENGAELLAERVGAHEDDVDESPTVAEEPDTDPAPSDVDTTTASSKNGPTRSSPRLQKGTKSKASESGADGGGSNATDVTSGQHPSSSNNGQETSMQYEVAREARVRVQLNVDSGGGVGMKMYIGDNEVAVSSGVSGDPMDLTDDSEVTLSQPGRGTRSSPRFNPDREGQHRRTDGVGGHRTVTSSGLGGGGVRRTRIARSVDVDDGVGGAADGDDEVLVLSATVAVGELSRCRINEAFVGALEEKDARVELPIVRAVMMVLNRILYFRAQDRTRPRLLFLTSYPEMQREGTDEHPLELSLGLPITSCDFLAAPLHIGGGHWVLAVLQRSTAKVLGLDSWSTGGLTRQHVERLVRVSGLQGAWTYDPIQVTRQKDMISCGLYMLRFAIFIAARVDWLDTVSSRAFDVAHMRDLFTHMQRNDGWQNMTLAELNSVGIAASPSTTIATSSTATASAEVTAASTIVTASTNTASHSAEAANETKALELEKKDAALQLKERELASRGVAWEKERRSQRIRMKELKDENQRLRAEVASGGRGAEGDGRCVDFDGMGLTGDGHGEQAGFNVVSSGDGRPSQDQRGDAQRMIEALEADVILYQQPCVGCAAQSAAKAKDEQWDYEQVETLKKVVLGLHRTRPLDLRRAESVFRDVLGNLRAQLASFKEQLAKSQRDVNSSIVEIRRHLQTKAVRLRASFDKANTRHRNSCEEITALRITNSQLKANSEQIKAHNEHLKDHIVRIEELRFDRDLECRVHHLDQIARLQAKVEMLTAAPRPPAAPMVAPPPIPVEALTVTPRTKKVYRKPSVAPIPLNVSPASTSKRPHSIAAPSSASTPTSRTSSATIKPKRQKTPSTTNTCARPGSPSDMCGFLGCGKLVLDGQRGGQCDCCEQWFHLDHAFSTKCERGKARWYCDDCIIGRHPYPQRGEPAPHNALPVTLMPPSAESNTSCLPGLPPTPSSISSTSLSSPISSVSPVCTSASSTVSSISTPEAADGVCDEQWLSADAEQPSREFEQPACEASEIESIQEAQQRLAEMDAVLSTIAPISPAPFVPPNTPVSGCSGASSTTTTIPRPSKKRDRSPAVRKQTGVSLQHPPVQQIAAETAGQTLPKRKARRPPRVGPPRPSKKRRMNLPDAAAVEAEVDRELEAAPPRSSASSSRESTSWEPWQVCGQCEAGKWGAEMIECPGCSKYFHWTCVGVKADVFSRHRPFLCPPCRQFSQAAEYRAEDERRKEEANGRARAEAYADSLYLDGGAIDVAQCLRRYLNRTVNAWFNPADFSRAVRRAWKMQAPDQDAAWLKQKSNWDVPVAPQR